MQLAGTTATVSLAGCNALQGSDNDGTGTSAESATVTVGVEPDQAQLQERQQEIQSELQSGNLTRSEAQSEYRTAQESLIEEAVNTFEARATAGLGLTIDDSVSEAGALLVTGPPAGLIGTLSVETVTGLFPQSTFERIRSQARTETPDTTE